MSSRISRFVCVSVLSEPKRRRGSVQTAVRPHCFQSNNNGLVIECPALVFLSAVLIFTPVAATQNVSGDPGPKRNAQQVESILKQMTLEEKVHMLFGGGAGRCMGGNDRGQPCQRRACLSKSLAADHDPKKPMGLRWVGTDGLQPRPRNGKGRVLT